MFATQRSARQARRSHQMRRTNRRSTRTVTRFERLEDRRLMAADIEWVQQFGTSGHDIARAVAADGSVYVAGSTNYGNDAFVAMYDPSGVQQWTIPFGSDGEDHFTGVVVDDEGQGAGVYVSGLTQRDGQPGEAFVKKYALDGSSILWTTPAIETAALHPVYGSGPRVALDDTGVYVTGTTENLSIARIDAYLRKLNFDGDIIWTREIGGLQQREPFPDESPGYLTTEYTFGSSLTVYDGNVYLAAQTTVPWDQFAWDRSQSLVRKYDVDGNLIWTERIGDEDTSGAFVSVDNLEIAAGPTGVYAFVPSYGLNPNGAYLRRYELLDHVDTVGTHHPHVSWTREFGDGIGHRIPGGVAVDDAGVFVAGTSSPDSALAEVFVRRYDTAGTHIWTAEFGTSSSDTAHGISVDDAYVYIAGSTDGQFPGEPSSGGADAFIAKVDFDADGDGIETSIDTEPSTFSNDFSDIANGGSTTGTITDSGQQTLTIVDAPNPTHGLVIFAASGGGPTPAAILVDGSTIYLDTGESVIVTHGSVEVQVLQGPTSADLRDENGEIVAVVNLPSGTGAIFDPEEATLVITGTEGNDVFALTSTGATLNGSVITVTSGLSLLTLEGGGGSDQFQALGIPPSSFQVAGGDPADRLTVTSTADNVDFTDGLITLREAILFANGHAGHDTISFNIAAGGAGYNPASGVFTIGLGAGLPVITDQVTINGYSQSGATLNTNAPGQGTNAVLKIELSRAVSSTASTGLEVAGGGGSEIKGLAIGGFTFGITLRGPSSGTVITGNFIGTDATGSVARPNFVGIAMLSKAANNRPEERTFNNDIEGNLISGNSQFGILVGAQALVNPGDFVYDTRIVGNYIGTNATGQQALSNGVGVALNSADDSDVGGALAEEANVIAFNTSAGVSIGSSGVGYVGHGNTVRGNAIYGNVGLGIDLSTNLSAPNGVVTENTGQPIATVTNGYQNFPHLQFVVGGTTTRVIGTLNSMPSAEFTLDFYANNPAEPSGYEGRRYLGSFTVITDENGDANFNRAHPWSTQPGEYITATATDGAGNTSEFSAPTLVIGDFDGDGIVNTIDVQPNTFSNDFSDVANGGTTVGTITSRGQQNLTIVDAPSPGGVSVYADLEGGTIAASIHLTSGINEVEYSDIDPGESFVTAVGSIITNVLAGSITATFSDENGEAVAVATLDQGSNLRFEAETVTFTVDPTSETPVEIAFISAEGEQATATVSASNEIAFDPESFTFTAPASNTEPVEVVLPDGGTVDVDPGQMVSALPISLQPDIGGTGQAIVINGTTHGDLIAVLGGPSGSIVATITTPTVTPAGAIQIEVFVATFRPTPTGYEGSYTKTIGSVTVEADVVHFPAPAGAITRIIAHGQAGNDIIAVGPGIAIPAILYGGQGDDWLKGGAGHDWLLGEDGNDLLVGGSGRDLLVGGSGEDRIVGNTDDDILIAGYTAFDQDTIALGAIMAEWTSSRSYDDRRKNISGTGSGSAFAARLNGNNFLNIDASRGPVTVHDDNKKDTLTGEGGRDWFFANLVLDPQDDATKKDKITDLSSSEFAADLDFILSE